jgi:hypothetical protein
MTLTEVVDRARSAVGHSCVYRLGKGGFIPTLERPWNANREADCSGFVSWCLGVSRHTDHPWYEKYNGGWLETTAVARDATSPYGMFDMIPWSKAKPGHVLVYGDRDGHQGHIGVVSQVGVDGPLKAIHCSKSQSVQHGDAIAETSVEVFRAHGAIVARCALIEEEA